MKLKVMELKIKDDINLEELKKFGLKFCDDEIERYEDVEEKKGKVFNN